MVGPDHGGHQWWTKRDSGGIVWLEIDANGRHTLWADNLPETGNDVPVEQALSLIHAARLGSPPSERERLVREVGEATLAHDTALWDCALAERALDATALGSKSERVARKAYTDADDAVAEKRSDMRHAIKEVRAFDARDGKGKG